MPRGFERTGTYRPVTPEYDELVQMFEISLRARGRSPSTIAGYLWALHLLGRFLVERGAAADPVKLTRVQIEEFMADLRNRPSKQSDGPLSTKTVASAYRRLHVFFGWLEEINEIERSPMAKMKPPSVQQSPPSVMNEDVLARLLGTCSKGRDFRSKRDYAIMVMLLDTGCRREEMASARVKDIDWENQLLRVVGKGNKVRQVAFGHEAAMVLRQYIRARRQFNSMYADDEALWIGHEGPLRGNSIYLMIKRRARSAGLDGVWVHLFRHSWAHYFLDAGGQERDLKRLGGWSSDQMVRWYGSSEADRRAQKAHREFSPANRLLRKDKKER